MRAFITQQRIPALYHFTDINHLPLIVELDGLRSKQYLEKYGLLDQLKGGGNQLSKELDVYWGNWDKVSLSWCAKLPMAYYREQEQHLCYIIVNKDYALQQGVLFTDRNATDNGQQRGEGLSGLQLIDFGAVKSSYPYRTPDIRKHKQSEILIPNHVPLSAITYIVFRSISSHREAERLCINSQDICQKFTVAERLFHLNSSYCKEHFLTSDVITNENVMHGDFVLREVFPKSRGKYSINFVARIYGINGSNVTFRFLRENGDIIDESVKTITKTDDQWVWHGHDISHFNLGQYQIEFRLSGTSGDIRQCSVPFTVIS